MSLMNSVSPLGDVPYGADFKLPRLPKLLGTPASWHVGTLALTEANFAASPRDRGP